MKGRSASQLDARTKRFSATSQVAHSGVSINSTRRSHWCSSMQRTKTQAPSLHWNMSIGWIGRCPQRTTGVSMYDHVGSVNSMIAAMHSWIEMSMC